MDLVPLWYQKAVSINKQAYIGMQATETAEATDAVSVQIIYSEGNDKGPENVWQFCSAALLPFALGIPARRVSLLLQK